MDKVAELDAALRTTYHEEGSDIILNTYQDVEPHMEYAKACQRVEAETRGAFGKREDFHRTMAVPMNVIQMVAQRLGIQPKDMFDSESSKRIFEELKGPEFAVFRTTNDKRI